MLPTWSSVGGIALRARGSRPAARASPPRAVRARPARAGCATASRVVLARRATPSCARGRARSRCRRRRGGPRPAGSSRPSRPSRMSGSGGHRRHRRRPRSSRSSSAAPQQPAGPQVRADRASIAVRSVGAVEQLHELHRGQDEVEAATEVERAGVGDGGLDVAACPRRARRELLEQVRVEVERRHAVAAARERAGHPPVPQPSSSTSQRLPRSAQLVPRVEVGGVGAALDVVPDRLVLARSFPVRRGVAAVGEQRRAARAGPCRWGGRRAAARRVSASARGRAPRSSAGITSSRRWPTPAYFSRSASSAARVPAHTTRPARGARISKSASQIQEMSRPSAIPSLRAINRSSSPLVIAPRAGRACGTPRSRRPGS